MQDFSPLCENLRYLRFRRVTHNRRFRLDDARLFARDFRQRVSQDLHVIQSNGRNDADKRRNDIRGIKPSAVPTSMTITSTFCR